MNTARIVQREVEGIYFLERRKGENGTGRGENMKRDRVKKVERKRERESIIDEHIINSMALYFVI